MLAALANICEGSCETSRWMAFRSSNWEAIVMLEDGKDELSAFLAALNDLKNAWMIEKALSASGFAFVVRINCSRGSKRLNASGFAACFLT